MKTLKKIAAIAAMVLGLGLVATLTSCDTFIFEDIDATFCATTSNFDWAVGTWDVSTSSDVSTYDGLTLTYTFPSAVYAQSFFASAYVAGYKPQVNKARTIWQCTETWGDDHYEIYTASKK